MQHVVKSVVSWVRREITGECQPPSPEEVAADRDEVRRLMLVHMAATAKARRLRKARLRRRELRRRPR